MWSERVLSFSVTGAVALAAALFGGYHLLRVKAEHSSAWRAEDADRDGIPLLLERDADGDGKIEFDDGDADNDGLPNEPDIVRAARRSVGKISDPLMGKYDNLLGKLGLVVCIDVVVDAWLSAGLSLPALLQQRADLVPERFPLDLENLPSDLYFARRVRNYLHLFEENPRLELAKEPRVGDVAFFGRYHAAIVVDAPGSGFRVVEAHDLFVREVDGREVETRTGESAIFGRIRR